jgi:hypothetical protein
MILERQVKCRFHQLSQTKTILRKLKLRMLKFSIVRILKEGKESKELPSWTWTRERFQSSLCFNRMLVYGQILKAARANYSLIHWFQQFRGIHRCPSDKEPISRGRRNIEEEELWLTPSFSRNRLPPLLEFSTDLYQMELVNSQCFLPMIPINDQEARPLGWRIRILPVRPGRNWTCSWGRQEMHH